MVHAYSKQLVSTLKQLIEQNRNNYGWIKVRRYLSHFSNINWKMRTY